MYYLKEIIGNCVRIVLWSAMIPLLLCTIFFPFSLFGMFSLTTSSYGPVLIIYYVGYFLLLSTVIMIRVYLIIEKWDQLFTIKNASSFLNLGIDGEKYLKSNMSNDKIRLLREKQELKKVKTS
ncbi:hypothetical protein MalM14_22210 [Gimesia chilikensis]|nr:hypothetical protein MalM14_22210 [Gimesia chilikensis]